MTQVMYLMELTQMLWLDHHAMRGIEWAWYRPKPPRDWKIAGDGSDAVDDGPGFPKPGEACLLLVPSGLQLHD